MRWDEGALTPVGLEAAVRAATERAFAGRAAAPSSSNGKEGPAHVRREGRRRREKKKEATTPAQQQEQEQEQEQEHLRKCQGTWATSRAAVGLRLASSHTSAVQGETACHL